MTLPYENSTSGERAINDMQKLLRTFGCNKFGHMLDYDAGELLVQFEYRGKQVSVKASINGYAAAWLKEHPHSYRIKGTKQAHELKAKSVASIAVYSILRDWIKGQITAVETGILSFEGAFLGQIMLPSGKTVMEHAADILACWRSNTSINKPHPQNGEAMNAMTERYTNPTKIARCEQIMEILRDGPMTKKQLGKELGHRDAGSMAGVYINHLRDLGLVTERKNPEATYGGGMIYELADRHARYFPIIRHAEHMPRLPDPMMWSMYHCLALRDYVPTPA